VTGVLGPTVPGTEVATPGTELKVNRWPLNNPNTAKLKGEEEGVGAVYTVGPDRLGRPTVDDVTTGDGVTNIGSAGLKRIIVALAGCAMPAIPNTNSAKNNRACFRCPRLPFVI
ncbi:MAG: hypothetical protein M3Z36_09720, partial [Acidobacteriota bacterium]|nr:hypothetical protein [Acidobacteriota bacterium]